MQGSFDRLRKQTMINNTNTINNTPNNNSFRNMRDDNGFNKGTFDDGHEYYNMGGTIENLADNRKKNINFIRGYEHAKRIANIRGNNKR